MASVLILLRLPFPVFLLVGTAAVQGREVGDDETTGGGISGSLHSRSGNPHKIGLFEKTDSEKPERLAGISPETLFMEILKSCKLDIFRNLIEPENWFSSRRKVNK